MSQRGRSRPGARRPRSDGAASVRRSTRIRPSGSTAGSETPTDKAGARPAGRGDGANSAPARATGTGRARPARVGPTRETRKSRSDRTILGLSTGRAVVLALVVCALALTLAVPLRNYVGQRAEAEQVALERDLLERDIERLEHQRALIEDPAWVRAQARERLRFVMPGDIPYQVQLPGDVPREDETPTTEKPTTGAWYSDLWRSVAEPPPAPQPEPVPQHMPVAPPEPGDITG